MQIPDNASNIINRSIDIGPAVIDGDNPPTVADIIDDMFQYHPLISSEQIAASAKVRHALAEAVKVIITYVPPGPDRTVAIRKIREARMDCNSSITHGGRY